MMDWLRAPAVPRWMFLGMTAHCLALIAAIWLL